YSHTEDNGRISDIVEAMIQKSVEQNVPLLEVVRVFFLATTLFATQNPALAFALDQVIIAGYERELALNEAQAEKHLNKLRSLALNLGHRGIMLTHSQGGLYGNRVFDLLTSAEQANTSVISTSTPAAFTAGGGPNTRLTRDGVANRFFLAGSLEGLVSNDTRACDTEDELKENSWPCHQFEEGYLFDVPARQQIVDDIAALLPAPPAFTDSLRFTETQMPLRTTGSAVPLTGNEYLAFGITVQNVYRYHDSRDPFSDGAENFGGSRPFGLALKGTIARINFTNPVSNLEIDWFTVTGTLFLDVYSTDNVLLFSASSASIGGTTSIINRSNIGYFTFHDTGGFVAVSNIRFAK
ncbi:MAG: hypothetical protein L0220_07125, partial [Acidobacteria bacterium]|nr:hypothetical protein [Acidobacteriota bacterium]